MDKKTEKILLGAGCFWGVEEAFRQIKGVTSHLVGYSGGEFDNPTYHDVCTGETGHAEVVEVVFDPSEVSLEELLSVFWQCHNPTTLNRQGPDIGTQYRSAIFYFDDEQKEIAEKSKAEREQAANYSSPIVTEITKATKFYEAEEYHQMYLSKRGIGNCH